MKKLMDPEGLPLPVDARDDCNFSTRWWRFSRYLIKDGRVQPAAGATLEQYDLWADFATSTERKRERFLGRAYLSFIQLGEKAALEGQVPDQDVLAWCNQFGLLGSFLFTTREISLYPRWRVQGPLAHLQPAPSFTKDMRTPTGWYRDTRSGATTLEAAALPPANREVGTLVPREFWWPKWEANPGVVIEDIYEGVRLEGSLHDVMGRYFLVREDQRETFPYPQPLSKAFWAIYSEPVDELVNNAIELATILHVITRTKGLRDLSADQQSERTRALTKLMKISVQATPILQPDDEGLFRNRALVTSLKAALAAMAFLDLSSNRLNQCANCGTLFCSTAGHARFHSPRCRKTFLNREWRSKKKEQAARKSTSRRGSLDEDCDPAI